MDKLNITILMWKKRVLDNNLMAIFEVYNTKQKYLNSGGGYD